MEIQPARDTRIEVSFRPEVVRASILTPILLHSSFAFGHSHALFLPLSRLLAHLNENLFLSAVRTTIFLAPIGMIIRVLGQGEPLGTRGCVSVGNEGRTSGFDVFEFGDRDDVCGEGKKGKEDR